jgi:hypothetical protein
MPDLEDHDRQELGADLEAAEPRGAVAVVKISKVIDLDDEPGLGEDLKGFVRELRELVDEMAQEADWTKQQFLEYAGCTSAARVEAEEVDADFMLDCRNYLEWVKGLLGGLDLASDRRGTIMGASRLFVEAHRDLHECNDALSARAVGDNTYTGEELIRLGEIQLGFETALANIDTPEGRLVKGMLIEDPAYLHSPHLSSKRVGMLSSSPSALGEKVARAMRMHLSDCRLCKEMYGDERQSGEAAQVRP